MAAIEAGLKLVDSGRESISSRTGAGEGELSRDSRARNRGGRSVLVWLLALATYAPLAAIAYWPVWQHWSLQMTGCACGDQVLEEWFLTWTPNTLANGHAVLQTNWLNIPGGVNVMWNTSMPLLGVIAGPLTNVFGPVHTYAIMATTAMAATGASMVILLRYWEVWWPACWLGGLLFAFSPYMVAEAIGGRLHLIANFLLPLIVLWYDRILR